MVQRPDDHSTNEAAADQEHNQLRRGWTTGSCATAASRAAFEALLTGHFPDPVTITLPNQSRVAFALCTEELLPKAHGAEASVIKDAGDDPDVTHLAKICASVTFGLSGSGIRFVAGEGVGTVTKPGLPIPTGEPAVNPVPRQMIQNNVKEVLQTLQDENHPALDKLTFDAEGNPDIEVTLSIPGGEELAQKTWNPRLGILGGLSILGTTGVVIPFSCSSWIHSIHRGIDVALANNRPHVAGCTGHASEKAVQKFYGLEDSDMLDMGDFAGGMLKYLRRHPVPRLTIGGGFGKLTKLAMGHMDLHSSRSQVDMGWLVDRVVELLDENPELEAPDDLPARIQNANTANQVLGLCEALHIPLGERVATLARDQALAVLNKDDEKADRSRQPETTVDVILITRAGEIVARSPEASGSKQK